MELNKIYQGNCLEVLSKLPDNSIDCCITSPPYWGLRDYGTAKWEGGNPECNHLRDNKISEDCETGHRNQKLTGVGDMIYKEVCKKCGAIRKDNQLGLEKTPEEYVANMVKVFSEVKRVLKPEGTLWLNLGDSYSGSGGNGYKQSIHNENASNAGGEDESFTVKFGFDSGLKPKDLVGIPWRTAFALQSDGWYLRQDIIWSKPNPMPESVLDRCTKAHEYIFLMSKSAKYYFNSDAIKDKSIDIESLTGRRKRNPDAFTQTQNFNNYRKGFSKIEHGKIYEYKNKRSVWHVPVNSYKEAHFATYPEKLIVPCILAGCPEGGIILDPFFGSGTTGAVAIKYNCNYVGVELNPEYIKIAEKRLLQQKEDYGLLAGQMPSGALPQDTINKGSFEDPNSI